MRDKRLKLLIAAGAVAFLLTPAISLRIHPNVYTGGRSRDIEASAQRNTSAIAVMLGEIRASMADIMFIKTERYLDSGIAYAPHAEKELMSITSSTDSMDMADEHAHGHEDHAHDSHAGTPTIIPPPNEDRRGIIGELQRRVKPWRDPSLPHEHTDGTELLPWYRLMTLSDPHNVRAYAIGSWWLKRHNPPEAIRFAKEGIQNNPQAFELPLMLAKIQFQNARKTEEASGASEETKRLYKEATKHFTEAARLAMKHRPEGGHDAHPDKWTRYNEEDVMAAVRMAALTQERFGDIDEAIHWASTFVRLYGGDPTPGIKALVERE